MLREEVQLLQEPGSYVGEVVKVMGKTKVLVKVGFGGTLCGCRLAKKGYLQALPLVFQMIGS
eukprot:494544-Pyramimonas_sp.AAC.1